MQILRIAVIGSPGTGKTSLATSLSNIFNLPHIEHDKLVNFIRVKVNGWNKFSNILLRKMIINISRNRAWIYDASFFNLIQTSEIYLSRADIVLWLDYSFLIIIFRLIRRTFNRLFLNREKKIYYKENFPFALKRELKTHYLFIKRHYRNKKNYKIIFEESRFNHLSIIRLKSPRETTEWLSKARAGQLNNYNKNGVNPLFHDLGTILSHTSTPISLQ